MTTTGRAAAFLGVMLAAAALAVTFAPATTDAGRPCGTWVNPGWTEEQTRAIVAGSEDTARRAGELGWTSVATRASLLARVAQETYGQCRAELDTRRAWALGLAGLAIIGPAGLVWTARGRRPGEAPGRTTGEPGDDTERAPNEHRDITERTMNADTDTASERTPNPSSATLVPTDEPTNRETP